MVTTRCAAGGWLLGLCLVLAAGCGRSSSPAPPAANGATPAAHKGEVTGAVIALGDPVTSGEYYDAALEIERLASELDGEGLDRYFDMESVCRIALSGLDVSDNAKRGFINGSKENPFGQQIVSELQQEGTYQLLRVQSKRGRHSALFRLISPAGLNYHDLRLSKNAEGKIVIYDFYPLVTGELLSQSVRRLALPFVAHENRNALQKLLQHESDYVKHAAKLQELSTALRAGDSSEALRVYQSMPPSMQEDKIVLIMRLMAAAQSEDWTEYAAAFAMIKSLYPEDAAIDLMSIDVLLKEKKYPEMRAAIDRIDKAVGGDSYLHVYRAASYSEQGDLKMAKEHLRKAAADPRAVVDVYWHLVTLSLREQDHAATAKYLLEIETRYGLEFDDLTQAPDYANFVGSPEYEKWLMRHEE